MAIFYQAKAYKDLAQNKQVRYYARVKSISLLTEDELANRVSNRSGVSNGVVRSVIRDTMSEVADLVTLGYGVQLPALGILRATLRSGTAATPDEVSSETVKRVNIRLMASAEFREKVANKTQLANFDKMTDSSAADAPDTGGSSTGTGGGSDSSPL